MSVVSENHGGPDAPEVDLRHRCGSCSRSLVGAREIVATATGDFCKSCSLDIAFGPPGSAPSYGPALRRLGMSEPEPE